MFKEEQQREFDIHAERMVRWLRANGHPHMSIVVDQHHAELLEGQMAVSVPFKSEAQNAANVGAGLQNPTLAQQCYDAGVLSSAPVRRPNVNLNDPHARACIEDHPLYEQFTQAIAQAMYGKGVRHGGAVTPFLDQPWIHYAHMHGIGFLTGQAAKKLEEAASTKTGDAFVNEIRGAMVYLGMALIFHAQTEAKGSGAVVEKKQER